MGRMAKVNQLIKRTVSQIIHQDIEDPRLEFVTITQADVSPDLQHAKISYSVLGDSDSVMEAGKALASATRYIRKLVSQRVQIRYIPELEFEYDRSIEYSARVEQTLGEIHADEDSKKDGGQQAGKTPKGSK